MGEDNNSFGGYQPTEDNGQVGTAESICRCASSMDWERPELWSVRRPVWTEQPELGSDQTGWTVNQGDMIKLADKPNGQYDQNYGQPGGQRTGNGQYGQGYGQPGDPYGQNYANQDMNMGGPCISQNNMPQESKGVSIASMVLGIFLLHLDVVSHMWELPQPLRD